LGVETPLEELPVIQKKLILDSQRCVIPVITATQMLESMVHNPRPTRAEVSDVANAVYDGTSAIMLSGETAAGEHPVEACRHMARIAERTEQSIPYHDRFLNEVRAIENTVTNAVARAAVTIAYDLNSQAIVTMTESGVTAQNISKFRPVSPIIACTPSETTYQQLSMIWGVTPLIIPKFTDADSLMYDSVAAGVNAGLLREGDITVFTAGLPLGRSGSTNLLRVHVVGEKWD
ncbi:MAG: pyruvate kinase, partial [Oscillospiraceae bacterium]|nr:pyruvate kinase [Oscillospiraceae bacterium]